MIERLAEKAGENLSALRHTKPLIHNITNFVVMNYTANALLAMGASPVMAHAEGEVEEMVAIADALVLNTGTLTDSRIDAMLKAGKKANALGIPVVLDPVGSGAISLRTTSAKRMIEELNIRVIRGNPSEILSLRYSDSKTKGVETIHSVDEAADAGRILALELNTTLAITGPVDLVTDGKHVVRVGNGHPLMGYVTGTGCTASAAIGAFSAVDPDSLSATAAALAFFGLAGEVAAEQTDAPGSFMIALIDALYTITPETLRNGCKIQYDLF